MSLAPTYEQAGQPYVIDPAFLPDANGNWTALDDVEFRQECSQAATHFANWLTYGDGQVIQELSKEYPNQLTPRAKLSLYLTYCAASGDSYLQTLYGQPNAEPNQAVATVTNLDEARERRRFGAAKVLAVAGVLALGLDGAQYLFNTFQAEQANTPVVALANHPTPITKLADQLSTIVTFNTPKAEQSPAQTVLKTEAALNQQVTATVNEIAASQPQADKAATPEGKQAVTTLTTEVDKAAQTVISNPAVPVPKKLETLKEKGVLDASLRLPELISNDVLPKAVPDISASTSDGTSMFSTANIYDPTEAQALQTMYTAMVGEAPQPSQTPATPTPDTSPTTPSPDTSTPAPAATPSPTNKAPNPTPKTPEVPAQIVTHYDINSSVLSKSGLTAAQFEQVMQGTGFAGLGNELISSENKYGINGLFILAHAMQEAGRQGNSYFARTRNNYFGIGAYDSNPNNATSYPSRDAGIEAYDQLLNNHYLHPGESEYAGATIHGIFVHYSTSHDTEAGAIASIMNSILTQIQPAPAANSAPPPQTPNQQPAQSNPEVAACPPGAIDLGIQQGYHQGAPVNIRLCAIPGVPSTSQESTPGNGYYINGANGNVIVNASIAQNVLDMVAAAKKDGIDLSAASSFRTNQHQIDIFNGDGHDTAIAAAPGTSNHQYGEAVDWNLNGLPLNASDYNFSDGRRVAPQSSVWIWLDKNGIRYGFKQYKNEPWHWSPDGK